MRRVLRVQKSVPKGMIYGELGRQELKFIIWQRMANFWKKINVQHNSFSFAEMYAGCIADAEFKKYVKDMQ